VDRPGHDLDGWRGARYQPGQPAGHYESWFVRANHPTRREAFWIRYTIFAPHGRTQDAIGELWAIHFDGESGRIRAAKEEFPIGECSFADRGLDVRIGVATLTAGALRGGVHRPHDLSWDLRYSGGSAPLLFLDERLYDTSLPKAKALTTVPLAVFNGGLVVDGKSIPVDGWVGSENHNWGRKHTDQYVWAQVAGFDSAPDAFLECATARLKLGPIWTPPMTLVCLRIEGEEHRLNALPRTFRAHAAWRFFDWRFDSTQRSVRIRGHVHAPREDFVALTYYNPPGGAHTCLNSKIAACEITLERPGREPLTLETRHRAAFEILTDDPGHGVPRLDTSHLQPRGFPK
jgi:hypothetical protein